MQHLLTTLIFIFGIIIGSFMNVCIFRIPEKADIVRKRSHCLGCGNVLKWHELIPLLSFLLQRGNCRHCRTKLSWQYPAVELINGIAYIWIFHLYGMTPSTLLYGLCASALIVLAVIDWRTFEIPVGINIFIGILGTINLIMNLSDWLAYTMGFIIVSGLFLLIYLLTKGRGIGGGDIKLMAVAGLLLGWQNILLALMIGCCAGSVIHLLLMKLHGKDRVLAFGPYLALGIFTAMMYGETIINWYLNTM